MKLVNLMSLHLKDVLERIDARKLSPKTKFDYLKLQGIVTEAGIRETDTDILAPAHFQKIMRVIERRGYSLRTQRNIVTSFRSIFNWGGPNGMNLITGVIYGPRFKGPSRRSIEVQQEEESPCRFIEREQILQILDAAASKMKVAIFLGINCGFYPSDTIAVHIEHFHLDGDHPHHCFRRVKTQQQRKAVLWPETVLAINRYVRFQRSARESKGHLLMNRKGVPYSAKSGGLHREFRKLATNGLPAGVGLGSLRHTFATVIDTVPDQSMIDLAMGHVNPSIQKRIYKQLNINELDRLAALANVVRDWLFNSRKEGSIRENEASS